MQVSPAMASEISFENLGAKDIHGG